MIGTADPPELLVRCLRSAGIAVPVDAAVDHRRALAELARLDPSDLDARAAYWAGRLTLIRDRAHLPAYDQAFLEAWGGTPRGQAQAEPASVPARVTIAIDTAPPDPAEGPGAEAEAESAGGPKPEPDPGPDPGSDRDDGTPALRWSRVEHLRTADLATLDDADRARVHDLLDGTTWRAPSRPGRRHRVGGRGPRAQLDLGATLRAAAATGGEPIVLHHRRATTVRRPLVILVDVSGSMAPYADALLRLAHAVVRDSRGAGRVEVFGFGTRLTRLTPDLRGHDVERAVARAMARIDDWHGGTRLGESLRTFHDRWGTTARSGVVVVLSDGWDRGDPDLVAAGMARLQRTARRVIWANPLKAGPGYEPLARGMAAALPFVDRFVEGHSAASLSALGAMIAEPVGGARR